MTDFWCTTYNEMTRSWGHRKRYGGRLGCGGLGSTSLVIREGDRGGKFHVAVTQQFSDFRLRAEGTFCNELRGDAIEDVSLWHDLMDRDQEAMKLWSSCGKSFALQMQMLPGSPR